jgi:tetratricopeptide (TPR) repeat protein
MAFASGCAARRMAAPGDRQAAEQPQPEQAQAKVAYERILGSFAATPDALLYLDPVLCAKRCGTRATLDRLERLVGTFREIGLPRGEAAARLNLGALLWRRGDPDRAYAMIRDAQIEFAAAQDVEGMAHSYEWLGFLFKEAGAIEEAGEHLAVAYQLFGRLEDHAAMERVLTYAED